MQQYMDVSPLAGHATLHFPSSVFVARAVQSMRSGCGVTNGDPKSCDFCVAHPQSATLTPPVILNVYCAVYRIRNLWSMLSVSLIHTYYQATVARNPCCLPAHLNLCTLNMCKIIRDSPWDWRAPGHVKCCCAGSFGSSPVIPCARSEANLEPCGGSRPISGWWLPFRFLVRVLGRGIYKCTYACIDVRIVNCFQPGFWHLHSIPTLHVHSQRRFEDWFLTNCSMALMPPPSTVAVVLFFLSFMSHGVRGQPDASQGKPVSSPTLTHRLLTSSTCKWKHC